MNTFSLFFDGACPLCRREVSMMKKRNHKNLLNFVDISAPDFNAEQYGLNEEDVNAEIHGMRADGSIVKGMEVFREAYARLGLGWIVKPTGWPLLKPAFDQAYKIFARNRHKVASLFGDSCEDGSCSIHSK